MAQKDIHRIRIFFFLTVENIYIMILFLFKKQKYLKGMYRKTFCVCVLVVQLYLTLCDPRDCSPPGSSVHGIFQARILEWVEG